MIFVKFFATPEGLRSDEVPHERFDLLVSFVGVKTIEQDDSARVLNILRCICLTDAERRDKFLPTAPPIKKKGRKMKICPTFLTLCLSSLSFLPVGQKTLFDFEQLIFVPCAVFNVSFVLHEVVIEVQSATPLSAGSPVL